ncbi:MAG: base excision DNA repair protein [Terracidiphilus sp.]|nr:base excision DNA repair protein [Terracidiphilus sp.]
MRPARGAAQRLRQMHDWLMAAYGPQHWWPAKTSIEVVVGAYLTQNTAWRSVERSLENLKAAGLLNVAGLRGVPVAVLEELVRPSGFARRKAPALKAFIALLDERFSGSLSTMARFPTAKLRDELLALPGVGPETADAILLYALSHATPMADEYLRRVVERHRLLEPAPGKNRRGYEALVELTRAAFEGDSEDDKRQIYNEFHALIVAVGKAHCGRRASCSRCPLEGDSHLNHNAD